MLNSNFLLIFENSDFFESSLKLRNILQLEDIVSNEIDTIELYCGYHSENINRYLRNFSIRSDRYNTTIQEIETLDNLIKRFEVKENIIAVRRMNNKFLTKDYQKGKEFIELGFLSTSLDINYRLDSESDLRLLNNETILILKIPKLLNGIYVENSVSEQKRKDEYELILDRGCKMKIEKRIRIFNNYIIVVEIKTSPNKV